MELCAYDHFSHVHSDTSEYLLIYYLAVHPECLSTYSMNNRKSYKKLNNVNSDYGSGDHMSIFVHSNSNSIAIPIFHRKILTAEIVFVAKTYTRIQA